MAVIEQEWRELDQRTACRGQLTVTLSWNRRTDELRVFVRDADELRMVKVRPTDDPRDVYWHPFSYMRGG